MALGDQNHNIHIYILYMSAIIIDMILKLSEKKKISFVIKNFVIIWQYKNKRQNKLSAMNKEEI